MDINRKLLGALLDLHVKSRSGILRFQRESAKKQLALHNGLLVFAESNQPQEHLAHVMVALGLLPRAKLNDIAASMKTGKTSEEAILALPDSSIENVKKGRREQAIRIVSSLLGWEDCDLRLYPGDGLPSNRMSLGMPLPELTIASVRQAVSKRLVSFPPHFLNGEVTTAKDACNSVYPLNRAEFETCSLLKTGRRMADVLPLMPAEEVKPEETLLCLYCIGLIQWTAAQASGDGENSASADSDPLALKLENLLARFESASHYEILSVSSNASQDEIQAAYHEQAKQLHPDRFQTSEFSAETRGRAEQVFALINEAYHILKTPASRSAYDLQGLKKKAGGAGPKTGAAQAAEMAEVLYRDGRQLLAKGDLETAVERLKGCVWLCPEKASYHYYLGVAESRVPRYRKNAEQHFLKAIELEDMSVDSHLALAKLYIDVQLPRKAELQVEQALRWDPHNSEAQKLAADLKKLR
jgi:DnaJ-domain-containing protein 1